MPAPGHPAAGFFVGVFLNHGTETDFLARVLNGRREAIALCEALFRVSQVIDDLYDRDAEVSGATLQRMAWLALVEIPSNGFYQAHFVDLQPLVRVALSDWFDSTELETGSEHETSVAFVLRDTLTALVVQCAWLIGGYAWMRAVSADIRRFFHDETLSEYQKGLTMQQNTSPS